MSVVLFKKYLNVFKSFKNYSFIWKFDYDDNEDPKRKVRIPKNVKIQEGLIQQTTLLGIFLYKN